MEALVRIKVALVTGANKGIGYYIVKGLLQQQKDLLVYVGARNEELGKEAVAKLGSKNAKFIKIDLDDETTIANAAKEIKEAHDGLDILINNAGMAWKGDAWGEEVAQTTINTNYFGNKNMCKHFLPLIREHGRVVMVSSSVGKLGIIKDNSLRKKFENPAHLTEEDLDALMRKFIQDVKNNTYAQQGWPRSSYGISKLGLNAFTRILIQNEKRNDVLIYSVCPGWCSTDMSSFSGPRSPAKGAETPVWLALQPENSAVKPDFYKDQAVQPW